MINIPPIKSPQALKTEVIADVSKTWKVGQILNATSTQQGKPQSSVLLQMGNTLIQAKTPVALAEGQTVQLLVKSLGDTRTQQLPLLKLIIPEHKTTSEQTQQVASNKLREFISVQQSFSLLSKNTEATLQRPTVTQIMPQPLQNALQKLQHSLHINTGELNARQLKQKLLDSGLFLENKLARVASEPAQQRAPSHILSDVKFQLLAIRQQLSELTPMPAKLASQSRQTMGADQWLQLQSLVSQPGIKPLPLVQQLLTLMPLNTAQQFLSLLTTPSQQAVNEELSQLLNQLQQSIQSQPRPQQSLQALIETLQQRIALAELGQQVDMALSKLTSLQLQPLSREADSLVLLLFSLVFKDAHEHFDIQFRIQQESESDDEESERWTATLSFNFKTLGQVQARIHLMQQRVSTVFFTERQETVNHIEQHLPLLRQGFENAGLDVVSIDISQKMPEAPPVIAGAQHLLDEKA